MLEAKNLHKVYNDGKRDLQVLKGIEIKIEKAKFIAIVGPSGAGKSTLLHILGGLDSPTSGEVMFQGEDIYKLSDLELAKVRNRKIGFVFQFYHLLSEFTVLENVLMPSLLGDTKRINLRENALEFLTQVGLGERLTHFPSQLSGGEKQRVAIVRSLINNPELLLCDEPTGNLDSKSGEEVIAMIKKVNAVSQTTILLVTHNLDLAKSADRVYHLKDGSLIN
ncbi:MAG: ABC transporter ATP-binding protein [Candidatus Omnitrophica bacterium]|nr:ABC transporter ATP-binding protein [Candidatus Omnitrophota bacterium]MCX5714447.1 ABC transporter ATP-binding protein [Candidatus Omnitrophota bacterium]